MATIKDVARQAGVSVATISRGQGILFPGRRSGGTDGGNACCDDGGKAVSGEDDRSGKTGAEKNDMKKKGSLTWASRYNTR